MNKLELYVLNSTLERLPEQWDISDYVNMNYSVVMKALYTEDFPNAWKKEELRKKIGTIGANDYYNKWTGKEFISIEDTPLNKLYSKVKDELSDGSIIDGKRTGIPLSGGNCQILFYNKKYVDKVPTTFEELIQMAKEIKEKHNLEYGFVFPTGACYFILPMLYGYGADLWSTPGEEPISYDALYKTICMLSDLIYTKKELPVKWEQEQSMPYFMSGKAAFCIGGDWNIREFDEALNHQMGICAIPKLERECRATANANYLFLSKELEEDLYHNAEKFCEKVLSTEVQTQIIKELYRMPAAKDYKLEESQFDELTIENYKIYNSSFILPPLKEVTNMYHVLADMLEPEVLISMSPEDLAKDVLEKLKDVDSYYKEQEK